MKQTTYKIGDKVKSTTQGELSRTGIIKEIMPNTGLVSIEVKAETSLLWYYPNEIELIPTFPYMPGDKVEYTGEIDTDLIFEGEIFTVNESDLLDFYKPGVSVWNPRFGGAVLKMSEIQPYPLLEV